jgi:iron complex outermembrane receptor protein
MKQTLQILVAVLTFTFLNYSSAFSTTGEVHGKVTDKGGQPIVGATVRILELDRATHTGSDGRFVFSNVPQGAYHIFVSTLGYASATNTVQVTANGVTETSFELRESAIPGEEVVVSASPYPRTESDQDKSVASKTAVELHQSSGSSFAEEIEDLPGVSVRWNGSAPARPMLRGLTDNDVLVLENGLRTGDISTFDPAHAVPIEPEAIEEVDVVRGPASVMFGPNAVGGLVNVITNLIPTASSEAVTGRASIMGNTVSDLYSGYFNTTISDGSSAFKISAGGLHSQDISIPSGFYTDPGTGQGYQLSRIPQSFDHTSEESVGYSYQGDFGMIGFGAKHYQMNWGIPGDPIDTFYKNPTFSRIQMENYSVELKGLFEVGGSFVNQIKLNANTVDYNHSEHPTAPNTDSAGNPNGTYSEFEQNNFHQNNYNASLQFLLQKMGNWQGTIGIWTNFDNLNIGGLQPLGPNSLSTDVAGYLYEEYVASENSRFEGGIRYDYNKIQTNPDPASLSPRFQTLDTSRLASALTGSIGIVQKLSNELTGSFSVARSFRAPTQQELFGNGPDDASASFILGDSSLVPETGIGIDASIKGNYSGLSFEVSPYINLITNYLYSYFPGGTDAASSYPYRHYAQTDARLYGFDATAAFQLIEHWAMTVSGSYVNASQVKDSVVPLPFIPPMKGLLRLNYLDNSYSGMIEWRLAAAQARLGTGDTPTAGYGIVNLGVGIKLVQGSMVHNISVHCDNLLNQSYRDNLSVIKDFLPQPARGFRLAYDGVF